MLVPVPVPEPELEPDPPLEFAEPELLPPFELEAPLLLAPLLLPPLFELVLTPEETSELVGWYELLLAISPMPLLPESELSGENPVKSLKTALSPSLIPYAVTPAAIHKTITTEISMLVLSTFPPLIFN